MVGDSLDMHFVVLIYFYVAVKLLVEIYIIIVHFFILHTAALISKILYRIVFRFDQSNAVQKNILLFEQRFQYLKDLRSNNFRRSHLSLHEIHIQIEILVIYFEHDILLNNRFHFRSEEHTSELQSRENL